MADNSGNRHRLIPVAALGLAIVAAIAFAFGVANRGGTALAAAGTPDQVGTATGWMAPHGGMRMGGLNSQITITAINGTSLSLRTTDGWTRTIDAAGATVTKGGQTIQLSDLKVGDTINFREARQSDGSFKITAIQVVLPDVGGTVSSVGANSVTITEQGGSSRTIQLTGSTTYQFAGRFGNNGSASKADLVAGVRIDAEGTVDSAGTFTATAIRIAPSVVMGTVASKTADTIVVTTSDGKSITVKVSSSTKYLVPGVSNATLANVTVGDRIMAEGKLESDGSLTADGVAAGAAGQGMPGKGWGRGHMGGMGGWGPMMPGTGPGGSAPSASGAPSV